MQKKEKCFQRVPRFGLNSALFAHAVLQHCCVAPSSAVCGIDHARPYSLAPRYLRQPYYSSGPDLSPSLVNCSRRLPGPTSPHRHRTGRTTPPRKSMSVMDSTPQPKTPLLTAFPAHVDSGASYMFMGLANDSAGAGCCSGNIAYVCYSADGAVRYRWAPPAAPWGGGGSGGRRAPWLLLCLESLDGTFLSGGGLRCVPRREGIKLGHLPLRSAESSRRGCFSRAPECWTARGRCWPRWTRTS